MRDALLQFGSKTVLAAGFPTGRGSSIIPRIFNLSCTPSHVQLHQTDIVIYFSHLTVVKLCFNIHLLLLSDVHITFETSQFQPKYLRTLLTLVPSGSFRCAKNFTTFIYISDGLNNYKLLATGETRSIYFNLTCETKNFIYMIRCTDPCNVQYIGEKT